MGPTLVELRVRNLGVIDDVTIGLQPGMTALTGETGAGKTLVVEALSLLLGGRADPTVVRTGADEAVVEGRFFGSLPGDRTRRRRRARARSCWPDRWRGPAAPRPGSTVAWQPSGRWPRRPGA